VLGRAKPRRRSRKERSQAASRAANAGLPADSVSAASAAADPAVGLPAPARYARSAADAPARSVDFGGSSRSCRPLPRRAIRYGTKSGQLDDDDRLYVPGAVHRSGPSSSIRPPSSGVPQNPRTSPNPPRSSAWDLDSVFSSAAPTEEQGSRRPGIRQLRASPRSSRRPASDENVAGDRVCPLGARLCGHEPPCLRMISA